MKRSSSNGAIAGDFIFDVKWSVELEPEIEQWINAVDAASFAVALAHIERLAERGNALRMPASRSLGDGLFELRLDIVRVALRIHFFTGQRRIVLLTVFREQRQNERHEVQRARLTMARCIRKAHTAEEG